MLVNNSPKDILFKNDARLGMLNGIEKLSNAVRETMGPRGRNVAIQRSYGDPYITKDGVTVAKEIDLADPVEDMGAQMVKAAAGRVADDAGDGPQPLWAKVLTPSGFITMGDAKVGMEISGTEGSTQTIEEVFPKGMLQIVQVEFSNSQVVECSLCHLFEVHTNEGTQVKTVAKLLEDYVSSEENSNYLKYKVSKQEPGLDEEFLSITKITPTGDYTQMQCIKVSNANHLYVTDGYIVTHNTTTSTVLTAEIAKRGYSLLAASHSEVELKRGIDKAVPIICAELLKIATPVSTKEDIVNVGTISANGETEIGEIIADAIDKVGDDGIITVRESTSSLTYLEIEEGMTVDRGIIDKAFFPENRADVSYDGVMVLVVAQEITNIQEILVALNQIVDLQKSTKRKHPLVIFTVDVVHSVLASLAANYKKGLLDIVIVKAPSHGESRSNILEDIATYTGATVLGPKHKAPQSVTPDDFGYVSSITVTASTTTLLEGGRDQDKEQVRDKINQRIEHINSLIALSKSEYDKDNMRKRLGSLSGGVAIFYVGGNSDSEVKEKKDRVDDALHATHAAIEMGIVPGGGAALILAAMNSRKQIEGIKFPNDSQKAGALMVLDAIEAPCRQICINAGYPADVVINKLITSKGKQGFNASTGEYGNLIKQGIIDPVKVTITALTQAASVAGMFLTTSCVIYKHSTGNPLFDNSVEF